MPIHPEYFLDVRCPTDYSRRQPHERPESHMTENERGYVFHKVQVFSGFYRRVLDRHPTGSRLMVVGGGRQRPPVGDVGMINVDFDPEAFRPLVCVDLNNIPDTAKAEPGGSLRRALYRAQSEVEEPAAQAIGAVRQAACDGETGGVLLSLVLQYLHQRVRSQVVGLGIAALREDGTLYVSDRHPLAFNERGIRLGFEEARAVAAEWGTAVSTSEYYRAPILKPEMRHKIAERAGNYERVVNVLSSAEFTDVPYDASLDARPLIELDNPPSRCIALALGQHVLEIKRVG
jgi:hypothetical protein